MDFQLPQGLQRSVESIVTDSGLPSEVVAGLLEHHTVVSYSKGSALFLQGSPADVLFWISSGIVEVSCPLSDGERVLVRLCGPGDILGHIDFFDEKRRRVQSYEAFAQTKCEVAIITREYLFRLLQALEPAQLISLIEYMNTRWSRVDSLWAAFIGSDYRRRLEAVFDDIALRLGVDDSRGTLLLAELRHQQLAEMIGCSRAMVTRLIDQMVQEGVLARQGKRYVLLNQSKHTAHAELRQHDDLVQWLAARTDGGPPKDSKSYSRSPLAVPASGRVDKPSKSSELSSRPAVDLRRTRAAEVVENTSRNTRTSHAREERCFSRCKGAAEPRL
jgi:CRP/FNR family cyclic AMP-dependent transcriptional regulator